MAGKRLLRNSTDDDLVDISMAEIRTEYKKLKNKYDRMVKGYYCHYCDRFLASDNFYESDNKEYKSGVIPMCKDCIEKIATGYDERSKKTNETEETIRAGLKICNRPFLWNIYKTAKEKSEAIAKGDSANTRSTSIFKNMMSMLCSLPDFSKLTYDDSDPEETPVEDEEEKKVSKKLLKTAIDRFGKGFTEADYEFLEREYQDWISRYTCENKAQETLFVRICCKTLEIHKAQLNGDDTKELDKTLQDLMNSLGIKPGQKNASEMTQNKVFGQLIDDWEQHDPIPEPSEEFKDVDRIGLYLTVFFYGHLAKMMNLKNAFSRLYDKWIKKWSVEKNIYEEDEESEEIFDKLFGSVGDDLG